MNVFLIITAIKNQSVSYALDLIGIALFCSPETAEADNPK
jgi:hypothetical protein